MEDKFLGPLRLRPVEVLIVPPVLSAEVENDCRNDNVWDSSETQEKSFNYKTPKVMPSKTANNTDRSYHAIYSCLLPYSFEFFEICMNK